MDFLGKILGSKDTCHHPDDGQILTTIVSDKKKHHRLSPQWKIYFRNLKNTKQFDSKKLP